MVSKRQSTSSGVQGRDSSNMGLSKIKNSQRNDPTRQQSGCVMLEPKHNKQWEQRQDHNEPGHPGKESDYGQIRSSQVGDMWVEMEQRQPDSSLGRE